MIASRPPAVAGQFYSDDADVLNRQMRSWLPLQPTTEKGARRPRGLIVPHAGYLYSGATAAKAFRHLQGHNYRRIFLLGPPHRVPVEGIALPHWQQFSTPLGEVPLDTECIEKLARLGDVRLRNTPHAREHCLEVQLPFLQWLMPGVPVVPMLVGDIAPQALAELLTNFVEEEDLLLISTDLSHFHPLAEAQQRDNATVAKILRLEAQIDPNEACGASPLNGALLFARERGYKVSLLAQTTSAEAGGDTERVVGYAAFALYH
ncbi:AmmeMemoRadiSam system protein B [Ferrimonas gelatinilytica]|uniref:MEMO1 family protein GCM10025772_14530 n=1 Tax=Ferrimonas gelatinilytica TaxID=1255257 RepID=A0ABP9S424_9GAMM